MELWCSLKGEYRKKIWFYQLTNNRLTLNATALETFYGGKLAFINSNNCTKIR